MMIWNDCKLIYENQKLQESCRSNTEELHAFSKYCDSWVANPGTVWYDTKEKKCFGMDQNWLNSHSTREACFVSNEDNFLLGSGKPCNASAEYDYKPWDKRFVLQYYGSIFGENIVENNEIMYLDHPRIKKFKNSKILLVGGGPTTHRGFDPEKYDYIWSCNHFFLNEKLNSLDLAMVVPGTDVDMSENNREFHEYLQNSTSLICFEDRFSKKAKQHLPLMKEKYGDRCVYAHTRYRGKIGAIPRLLCTAVLFGAREIHFIGMDGMAAESKRGDFINHAFQKEKKFHGVEGGTRHEDWRIDLNYNRNRRHYTILWDYIINNLKALERIKFQNLGEGHPKNQTTDISRQMFPLEKL